MIGALNVMWPPFLSSFLGLMLATSLVADPALRTAPNPRAVPANQLKVAGNACGPTALLNAFRFGNADWQRASDAIAGASDRERILRIIREAGMRPSRHMNGHARWSRRGVGVADLCDMGNELITGKYLPQLSEEVFLLKAGETPAKLLARVHRRLSTSLEKGLPPILSIRRYALRQSPGKPAQWIVIEAHFVTLTSIPRKFAKTSDAFPVSYIDPWGGKSLSGFIRIPRQTVMPDPAGQSLCLEADFPGSSVGKKLVRKGERSALTLSAAIGRW
jgi:hypothetical protein